MKRLKFLKRKVAALTIKLLSRLGFVSTRKTEEDMIIGAVLKKSGLLTENQLKAALEHQKKILFEHGTAVPIGKVIVEMGYAGEEALVEVINRHYNLSVNSLSDNIKELVVKMRGTLTEEVRAPRFPIWFQLAVTIMLVLAISIGTMSYVVLERQRDKFYRQTVKIGIVSLNFFANNSSVPLLQDDILSLNTILKNVKSVDGHLYAFIIDNNRIIKAHTDQDKIGTEFVRFYNVDNVSRHGDVTYFNYVKGNGQHVLNVSRPILFKEKVLGEVHVGLSIDFIERQFLEERAFLAIAMLSIIFLGMIVAILFGFRFSRPITKLVRATKQISLGNYGYKVCINRADEMGTLAQSFNSMSDELSRQSLMKKSFGKYVGSEVLNMIMDNPEKEWLKGRRNNASILVADIRDFTAYSETREPEAVVEKLNEYFEIATRVILRHGGYTDKFIGDAVLGVFGVPVYHENHLERCIRAAVEMQEEFAAAAENGNMLLARVGVAVNSGIVVAGNLGSQSKMEYTVIGDTVNIAFRLNGFAAGGEILLGDCMPDEADNDISFEPLPPQKVKGKKMPIKIYRVVCTADKEECVNR